jgi:YD repeat-containing protein
MPKIIVKKSTVSGKAPVAEDLDIGELAVNTADGFLYTKHNNNTIKRIRADVYDIDLGLYFSTLTVSGVSYDEENRVTQKTHHSGNKQVYTYNNDGLIESIEYIDVDGTTPVGVKTFFYDEFNRFVGDSWS